MLKETLQQLIPLDYNIISQEEPLVGMQKNFQLQQVGLDKLLQFRVILILVHLTE